MAEATKPDDADDAVVKSDTKRDVMKLDVVTEEEMDKNMPDAVNKENAENGAVTQPDEARKPDDTVVKSDMKQDVMKGDVVTEEELDKKMLDAVNKENAENGAVTQLDDAVVMKNDELDKKKPEGVTKLNYRTEMKEIKFDFKCFHCNICDHAFWTEGGLRQHSSSHDKTSPFDQDRHTEELYAECKRVESKHEKPKETNGNKGTNGNGGTNGNEGKNPEVIVFESNGDEPKGDAEPNETTEKNIQSNNTAEKDNEITENSRKQD